LSFGDFVSLQPGHDLSTVRNIVVTTRRAFSILKSILLLLAASSLASPLPAAEWTWTWKPAPGETKPPTVEICNLKYGKQWAYAIEIDDGPKWVSSFAVPFLAQYHYTDAPPGVSGGAPRPFLASAAVIAGVTGNNESLLNWDDLKALLDAGWGVMNHSFDHHANDWSGDSARLTDQQALEDAFWSQSLFAAKLPGGRAPTGAVYANGYAGYNHHDALAACGIGIATRVGGSSPRNLLSPDVNWLDYTRSYLDEKVWSNESNKGQPMADFPANKQDGPAANSLVIDFTHEIERQSDSANQGRWRTRLKTIESRWGASGADTLWCAPTSEVADYTRAARAAKVEITNGKLTVSLPDTVPGSALTLRLHNIGTQAMVQAPEGGSLYRQGNDLVLTSPRIGLWGAPPLTPRLKCVYDGPAISIDFKKPLLVAGVTLRIFGNPSSALLYRLAVRTSGGEKVFAERTVGPGWTVGGHLCPIIPTSKPITGTGIVVTSAEPLRAMAVWVVDEAVPNNVSGEASNLVPLPLGEPAVALPSDTIDLTRDQLLDHIRGGWTGMLIGGIEGLAHEFKYIPRPRQELPDYPFLPQGARSDDDNDFEWTHLFFMDLEGSVKIPYPRLVEIWKANMNTGIWCANEQARKLMDQGIVPPETANPSFNRFSPYNLAGQFCVEAYGMIAPGMPQTAEEIGLHYARVSVSGEPLQAAQYWTALISLAAVSNRPMEDLLRDCMRAVDPASAQAEAVQLAIKAFHDHPADWKAARQFFHEKWYCPKEQPWDPNARPLKWNDNSTPLNGAMVILALLYGHGDFYRTGQYAMALGYDADCNAATACAVAGTRLGFAAIEKLPQYHMPDHYLNLTRPQLPHECKVSDQAAVMLRLSEKLILANGGERIRFEGREGYRVRLQTPRPLERLPVQDRREAK
jgi:hypothetical protein